MNMKAVGFACFMVAAFAGVGMAEDGWTFFDGKWRISGGAVYNSPVKSNLRFMPVNMRRNEAPSVIRYTGATKAEAEAKTHPDQNGKYPNGAFFVPDGLGQGEMTWKGYIPSVPVEDYDEASRRITFFRSPYSETLSQYDCADIASGRDSDSSGMPGFTIELSRELYRNEEHGYGLDLAFGFNYFFGNDFFKTGYGYQAGTETESERSGSYDVSIAAPDELDYNDWCWGSAGENGNGMVGGSYGYGLDTAGVGGPVFDMSTIRTTGPNEITTPGSSTARYGYMRACGDYRQLEFLLTARPYYDVTDWLRIYGTIGVALSYDQIDMHVTMRENGHVYRHSSDHDEWDIYGVGGLGAMLRYDDYSLGVDFTARFLDNDIDFYDKYISGTVERGDWTLRVTVGYSF